MSDAELLRLRFKDLPLKLEGTLVYRLTKRLNRELRSKGITFEPHVWFSDEWYSPDGIPGIALPFYLAHPRLMKLELKQMLEVEGAGERECMKILRHEAGHAIDTAYRLHFQREYQRTFGSFAKRYPNYYRPRPASRKYVLHLNNWYAQAHPAEDFAETFAVWLTPNSRWRQHYEGWPALKKLQYVDSIMTDIAATKPKVRNRQTFEPTHKLQRTLAQHYQKRQSRYLAAELDFYDEELARIFSSEDRYKNKVTAAAFIRSRRHQLRQTVAHWTGTYQYTVDQVLQAMMSRAQELKLRLGTSERKANRDISILVTVATMNLIHSGRNQVAL